MSSRGLPAGELIGALRSRGIEATVGTNAIPFTRYYATLYGVAEEDLPHTVDVGRRAVTLPLYPQMTEGEQDIVVQAVSDCLRGGGEVDSAHWHHLPDNPYNPHAGLLVGESEIGEGCWIGAFAVVDGSGGLTIGRGCASRRGLRRVDIPPSGAVDHRPARRPADIERAATRIGDFVGRLRAGRR